MDLSLFSCHRPECHEEILLCCVFLFFSALHDRRTHRYMVSARETYSWGKVLGKEAFSSTFGTLSFHDEHWTSSLSNTSAILWNSVYKSLVLISLPSSMNTGRNRINAKERATRRWKWWDFIALWKKLMIIEPNVAETRFHSTGEKVLCDSDGERTRNALVYESRVCEKSATKYEITWLVEPWINESGKTPGSIERFSPRNTWTR